MQIAGRAACGHPARGCAKSAGEAEAECTETATEHAGTVSWEPSGRRISLSAWMGTLIPVPGSRYQALDTGAFIGYYLVSGS